MRAVFLLPEVSWRVRGAGEVFENDYDYDDDDDDDDDDEVDFDDDEEADEEVEEARGGGWLV